MPPSSVVKASEFAPWHRTYAKGLEKEGALEPNCRLDQWFRETLEQMESASHNREQNRTVALALLPAFRSEPSLWRDCVYLNRWDPHEDETFAEYLDSWTACVRSSGREPRTPQVVQRMFGLDSWVGQAS